LSIEQYEQLPSGRKGTTTMSHSMNDPASGSAIKLNAQQEAEIAQMNSVSEIQAYLHQVALDQRLVVRDNDPYYLQPVEAGSLAAAKSFAKVLVIGDQKHILECDSQDALVRAELDLMRELFGGTASATTTTQEQPRDETTGKFVPRTDDPAAVALAPSVVAALAAAGIDPEALRDFSNVRGAQAFESHWAAATEEFRKSPAGADWPGGIRNRERLGQALDHLGLTNNPSVESLAKAFRYLKDNNLLGVNEAAEYERGVKESGSFEELKQRAGYQDPDLGGQVWGR
jgi:hypothetical protein